MNILILLPLLILAHKKELIKNDNNFKYKVFSLVGISLFVFAYYTQYACKVFEISSQLCLFVNLLITSATALLCISPLVTSNRLSTTIIITTLSTASICLLLLGDIAVKNLIAEKGGYYKEQSISYRTFEHSKNKENLIKYSTDFYDIHILKGWKQERLKTGQVFFTKNKKNVELRPKCLAKIDLDIPSLVDRIVKQDNKSFQHTETLCTQFIDGKTCLIKSRNASQQSNDARWRLLLFPEHGKKGNSIEVDVVFDQENTENQEEVMFMFKSLKLKTENLPTDSRCITPSLWL